MRYIIAMGILAVTITLSQSNRQAQQPAQAGQLEQEFIKLEQQWMEAVQKQDDSALGRIMATDFVHTTSVIPGIRTNKTQFIEASIQLTSRLGSFSLDQVAVRLVGDVAVVNALYSQKARQGEVNLAGVSTEFNARPKGNCAARTQSGCQQRKGNKALTSVRERVS